MIAPPGAQRKLSHEESQNSPAFSNSKMPIRNWHFRKGKEEETVQAGLDRDTTKGDGGREGRARVRKKIFTNHWKTKSSTFPRHFLKMPIMSPIKEDIKNELLKYF